MASYNKSKQSEITTSEREIYYNLTISNVDSADSDNVNQLIFIDKRDTPIVPCIKDYAFSIIRWELSTHSLPVFYFVPKRGNDPNEGIYSVSLAWRTPGNTIYGDQTNLLYVPQDKSKAVPPAPDTFPLSVTPWNEYYYIYNFNNFIDMLNEALNMAFTKLQGDVFGALDTAKPPVVVWDKDTLKATIYSELDFYDVTQDNHIQIYFNRPLYSLFNSFPMYKYLPTSNGRHYQILTNPRNGIQTATIPAYSSAQLIVTSQEFPTNESWSPISSILFSTTAPIVGTIMSNPTVYSNGVVVPMTTTYNNQMSVISDFQTDQNNYRSTIFYLPSAEYRMQSFLNIDTPLYKFDLYGYILNRLGQVIPLTLPSNSIFSMKVMFRKLN